MIHSYKLDSERPRKNSMLLVNELKYWNRPNPKYDFNNGILFNQKDRIEENCPLRFDEMLSYSTNDNKKKKKVESIENVFIDLLKMQTKHQLLKLFYYDEQKFTWVDDVYTKFIDHLKQSQGSHTFPLVAVLESFENEQISLISKLPINKYPDFDEDDDDQIFVYGISDSKLSLLSLETFKDIEDSKYQPIFLLLHVPEKVKQRQLPNIQKIIIQIYTYLTFISDFNIVILNRDYCVD